MASDRLARGGHRCTHGTRSPRRGGKARRRHRRNRTEPHTTSLAGRAAPPPVRPVTLSHGFFFFLHCYATWLLRWFDATLATNHAVEYAVCDSCGSARLLLFSGIFLFFFFSFADGLHVVFDLAGSSSFRRPPAPLFCSFLAKQFVFSARILLYTEALTARPRTAPNAVQTPGGCAFFLSTSLTSIREPQEAVIRAGSARAFEPRSVASTLLPLLDNAAGQPTPRFLRSASRRATWPSIHYATGVGISHNRSATEENRTSFQWWLR